jgi:hypothetical protein
LLEVRRFPERVRQGFPPERADPVLAFIGRSTARWPLRIQDLLTSRFGRDGTIVPGGELLVEADSGGFLVVLGGFFSSRVFAGKDIYGRGQPGFRVRAGHRLAYNLQRGQQQTLAGSCHVRKEAMFDRIIL